MKTRSAVLWERGRPPPYAESRPLALEELDLDEPGPTEVLVKVEAAGLCHSDLSVIDGSRPRPTPMVLGHEAAGVVEAAGREVPDLQEGDRVIFSFTPMCGRCIYCLSGRPALCENGARSNGGGTLLSGGVRFRTASRQRVLHHLGVSAFSEHTVVSSASCVKIDSQISPVKAALFGCALMTGVGAVINTAQARPGQPAVVFGLGGVGLSAVMGAALVGCNPIVAVDRHDSKLELARGVGATHTVRAGEAAMAEIREATGGGAEYAIESVGSAEVLAQAYAATRRGGKTLAVGLPHPERMLQLQAVSIVAEERQLLGSYMGSAVPTRDIPMLIRLYEAGKLPVDSLFTGSVSLEDVNGAFDALSEGRVVRQVITF
jgi:alcohol dehydrogenase